MGQRAVGRTRGVKFDQRVTWERPQERFRLPFDDVCGSPPAALDTATTSALGQNIPKNDDHHFEPLPASGVNPDEALCTEGRGKERGNPVAPLADGAVQHTDATPVHHHAAPLTIEVWSKRSSDKRRDFLGSAIVPARVIEHPLGGIWLPLGNGSSPPSIGGDNLNPLDGNGEKKGTNGVPIPPAPAPLATEKVGKERNETSRAGRGLFKSLRGLRPKGSRLKNNTRKNEPPTGSVHVWLGKNHRSSASGHEPGRHKIILRVHAAAGLRKVKGYASRNRRRSGDSCCVWSLVG